MSGAVSEADPKLAPIVAMLEGVKGHPGSVRLYFRPAHREADAIDERTGHPTSYAHREAQPEPDGGGEEMTSATEVLELLRSRTDPMVKAMNRAQMDDACRVELAYALIADRKGRALQSTPEGQTEGAVDLTVRAFFTDQTGFLPTPDGTEAEAYYGGRWISIPIGKLTAAILAALASKGV